ncbi:hypothetical protein, partial [Saccharothrix sp. ST-888]|uniref:hypothetical protein n=1 Tax=Saccharothrix sp. ST-888 TaxID=1427391 RepID=UPI000AAD9E48
LSVRQLAEHSGELTGFDLPDLNGRDPWRVGVLPLVPYGGNACAAPYYLLAAGSLQGAEAPVIQLPRPFWSGRSSPVSSPECSAS